MNFEIKIPCRNHEAGVPRSEEEPDSKLSDLPVSLSLYPDSSESLDWFCKIAGFCKDHNLFGKYPPRKFK